MSESGEMVKWLAEKHTVGDFRYRLNDEGAGEGKRASLVGELILDFLFYAFESRGRFRGGLSLLGKTRRENRTWIFRSISQRFCSVYLDL